MLKNKIIPRALLVVSLVLLCSSVSAQQTANENAPRIKKISNTYSNKEFNELLIASLAKDVNGQKFLAASNNLNTTIHGSHVEFSAVIDLDKVQQVSPEARNGFKKFDQFLFLLNSNQLPVTVLAELVPRNGRLGIRDNFSISLGPIPISNDALRQLGINVSRANSTNLKLNDIFIQSIKLETGRITLRTLSAP